MNLHNLPITMKSISCPSNALLCQHIVGHLQFIHYKYALQLNKLPLYQLKPMKSNGDNVLYVDMKEIVSLSNDTELLAHILRSPIHQSGTLLTDHHILEYFNKHLIQMKFATTKLLWFQNLKLIQPITQMYSPYCCENCSLAWDIIREYEIEQKRNELLLLHNLRINPFSEFKDSQQLFIQPCKQIIDIMLELLDLRDFRVISIELLELKLKSLHFITFGQLISYVMIKNLISFRLQKESKVTSNCLMFSNKPLIYGLGLHISPKLNSTNIIKAMREAIFEYSLASMETMSMILSIYSRRLGYEQYFTNTLKSDRFIMSCWMLSEIMSLTCESYSSFTVDLKDLMITSRIINQVATIPLTHIMSPWNEFQALFLKKLCNIGRELLENELILDQQTELCREYSRKEKEMLRKKKKKQKSRSNKRSGEVKELIEANVKSKDYLNSSSDYHTAVINSNECDNLDDDISSRNNVTKGLVEIQDMYWSDEKLSALGEINCQNIHSNLSNDFSISDEDENRKCTFPNEDPFFHKNQRALSEADSHTSSNTTEASHSHEAIDNSSQYLSLSLRYLLSEASRASLLNRLALYQASINQNEATCAYYQQQIMFQNPYSQGQGHFHDDIQRLPSITRYEYYNPQSNMNHMMSSIVVDNRTNNNNNLSYPFLSSSISSSTQSEPGDISVSEKFHQNQLSVRALLPLQPLAPNLLTTSSSLIRSTSTPISQSSKAIINSPGLPTKQAFMNEKYIQTLLSQEMLRFVQYLEAKELETKQLVV